MFQNSSPGRKTYEWVRSAAKGIRDLGQESFGSVKSRSLEGDGVGCPENWTPEVYL